MSEHKQSGMMKMISFGKITFVFIVVASTVLLVGLVVPYSVVDLRMSSLLQLWITSQLIIFMIWKFSDIELNNNNNQQPQNLEVSLLAATDSLENWYGAPSSIHDPREPEPMPPPDQARPEVAIDIAADAQEDSMDETWKAVMERSTQAGRPVLTKSETWEGHGSAEADAARARRAAALRRSDSTVLKREVVTAAAKAKKKKRLPEVGWRGREALLVGQDELFQRVETFIKNHYDHLRLQRQESEQRRSLERIQ